MLLGGFGRPCFSLTVTADMVWIVDPGLGTPDADGGSATARGTLTVTGSNPFTQNIGCEDSLGNGGGCGVIGTTIPRTCIYQSDRLVCWRTVSSRR